VGGELEPTPGAGPLCIENVFETLSKDDVYELFSQLVSSEVNYVDVLLFSDENEEVYAHCFISLRCLEVIDIVVKLCGERSRPEALGWPEVDKATIEEECVELRSRPEPPLKVRNLLRRLGLGEPVEIKGYRTEQDEWVGATA